MSSAITAVAVAAGGAYLASRSQSDAARDARHASERATSNAVKNEYMMFSEAKELQQPFYESAYKMIPYAEKTAISGYEAYPTLLNWASDTNISPLTQLQLKEGNKQLNQQLAARGMYNSGAGLNLLRKYSEGVLATEADKKYSRLLDVSKLGMGQTTLSPGASVAANAASGALSTGNNVANLLSNQGVNTSNGLLAQGNIRSGMYDSLTKSAGTMIGYFGP
jgi:hypothetical protein